MKKILSLLLMVCSLSAGATNYYFSASTGNDAAVVNSISTPWRTLTKLNSSFATFLPGDHILFNRGDVFYGIIKPTKNFTAGNPLVFGSYGTGDNPVITGLSTISGWTNLGSNIWESTSTVSTLKSCMIVLINGVNIAMGRTPNTGYYTYQTSTKTTKTSTSLNAGTINWSHALVVSRKNNWVTDRDTIVSQAGSTITHTYHNVGIYNGIANYGFFIENDTRTLDAQNEWYYNDTTRKLRIYSTTMPANVQLSTIDTLVYTKQFDYITFENIDFVGSNKDAIVLPGSAGITIQNCNFFYHGKDAIWGANNYGTNSGQSFILRNCTFNHINNLGINLESEFTGGLIQSNTFKNIGMQEGMAGDGGTNYNTSVGIFVHASGTIVENNTVDSTGYDGIAFYGSDITIRNNYVQHHCCIKIDGGGIYTWFGPAARSTRTNQKVYNNTVANGIGSVLGTTQTTPLVEGYYMDDGTGNVELYGNTAFNNAYAGFFIHNDSPMNVHNNTSYNNGIYQALITSYTTAHPLRNFIFKSNVLFAKASTQKVASIESGANDIGSFGSASSIDSNYYTRPIDENNAIQTIVNGSTTVSRTLASWKTFSGFDAHANKATQTVPSTDSIRFEFNETAVNKTVVLDANYIDVSGAPYNGSIVLLPYTSAVLIRSSALAPGNVSPVAHAGIDSTIKLPRDSVHLLGSGSDADGTVTSYAWSKISGPGATTILNPTSQNVVASGLLAGTYVFQLRVTDNLGATGLDSVTVTVNPANIPPTANAGADQSITLPTNTATLTGSGGDVDGTVASYNWSQISGPNSAGITSASSASTGLTGLIQGTYVFQIKVKDNSGDSAMDITQVIVNPTGNVAPTADAGVDQFVSLSSTTLIGSGTDTDGTIASYAWTRVSGPNTPTIVSASSASTSVTGMINGIYTFRITVTDNMGATATDTVQVTVNTVTPTIDFFILHGKIKLQ